MDTVTDTHRLHSLIRGLDSNPFGPSSYFAAGKIFRQLSAVPDPMDLPEGVREAMAVFSISHDAKGHGNLQDVLVPACDLITAVREAL